MDSTKLNPHMLTMPIWALNSDGSIKPNPLFHRPWDKLHSRCIEYPFAASRVNNAGCILDVGTAQADNIWMTWLSQLPLQVHITDYDRPNSIPENLTFWQGDIRKLPIKDETFDVILAVSVIEHIGLENSMVRDPHTPPLDQSGDVAAFAELLRLLKPDGELVMTFPFGLIDGLILGSVARAYTLESIKRFKQLGDSIILEYYEYQNRSAKAIYHEHVTKQPKLRQFLKRRLQKPKHTLQHQQRQLLIPNDQLPPLPGTVTWRRIPLEATQATHQGHVDGVLCSVWRKRSSPTR